MVGEGEDVRCVRAGMTCSDAEEDEDGRGCNLQTSEA